MGRIANSWSLTRESWRVLCADKSLMVFPALSAAASIAVFASFALPVVALFASGTLTTDHVRADPVYKVYGLLLSFLFYATTFFTATYCNVALVGCALERFEGKPTSFRRGIQIANSRIAQILAWSLVAATVGTILRAIEERAGFIGRIVIGLIGLAWAVATFFVVPVLVVEGVGPIDAVRRSAGIIRQKWGEALIVTAGISLVLAAAVIGVVLLTAALVVGAALLTQHWALPVAVGSLGLIAVILVALVGSTLKEIVNAALYRFATTGDVAPGFTQLSLQGVFKPKGK
ncbi:MAG: hypothetical protein JNK53_08740 [Phycisphaerae bacterium]|nr:hypothetical protein [Phycisphaerae bacterium]